MGHLRFLAFLLLATMLAGCAIPVAGLAEVASTGKAVTMNEDLSGFTRVASGMAFDLNIEYGEDYSVRITVDEAVKPYLDVRVDGNTLYIYLKPNVNLGSGKHQLSAQITMPLLEGLDLSGASKASITGFDSESALSVKLSGASSAGGDIAAGAVKMDLSGASRATLDGKGGDLDLEVSGASIAHLGDFLVESADVKLSGASQAEVTMAGTLNADVSGASTLKYAGEVQMGTVESSGASRVVKQ